MLNDFQADRVYIACGYTDLRRGIDGLASLVESQFRLDPFSRALFLFCGRRNDRIKALYYEGDGFVLLYKRLENGSPCHHPAAVPVADGRTEHRAAKGAQNRFGTENDVVHSSVSECLPGHGGSFSRFVIE